jgi:uncharacterized tellurite resistance protein B-like protein
MIDLVKKFFEKSTASRPSDREGANAHDIRVATCALFLEMANIDGEFTDVERKNILSILKGNFQLSNEYADELLEASIEELKRSIDLWQFTNLINENYSEEEKIQIIEMVWAIIYIDGKLDQHEDYLVHKLAKLLRLSHRQLIDAKLKILHGRAR